MRLRKAVKDLVATAVARLPWGLRQRIFEELLERHTVPHDLRYDAIVRLAASCNVHDFTVLGDQGPIRGSARDVAILKQYALRGRWAERTVSICKRFFANCHVGTYIDIGANIGLTTIPIAKGQGVWCIAIEAEPTNFTYLRENIDKAGVANSVDLCNVAVFSRTATLDLEIASANLGDHRIRPHVTDVALQGEDQRKVVSMNARPLDDIVGHLDPDFSCLNERLAVKVDVQGAEPFVFEGGDRVLGAAGLMIVEYSPYCMARMRANPESILRVLEARFTRLRVAQQEEDTPSEPMPISDAIAYLRHFAEVNANNPFKYLDIIAERD